MHGDIGNFDIDHINCIRHDNRIDNLRLATRAQNLQNRKPKVQGKMTSRFTGVFWHKHKQRWFATIMVNGVRHGLGHFKEEELAAKAYLDAKKKLHPFGGHNA